MCVGCDYFNFVRILIERSLLKPDILYNFATLKVMPWDVCLLRDCEYAMRLVILILSIIPWQDAY